MPFRHTAAVIAAVLFSMIAACAPRQDYRGASIDEDKLNLITVGETTEPQVGALLGSPSTTSTFPEWGTTYYYISSETEAVAFLAPELIDQQVLAISFDKEGKVREIKRYGLKDGKQIAFVERETPTRGKELTFLEQLFGNLGRFNSNAGGATGSTGGYRP
ncbi:outer membrane protein assembly factor BamE [uncultured Ferrovibrio sp.]|jgi:outer membrane protein assembly factor BamE (lipoprotein component of BamABCDE complex)|uniref:outer membrane protein assembly factor BamE n=1 Tax=uncultured Ferrovibrio sp. TaxID=1576913 RepID=UPI00261F01F8|nr:outer membrane protein assembly factor BamE [uncultured Ferrovibrio sp.]